MALTPSVLSDPKLQYASPTENELRVTYPFANLYFSFPTKPYSNNHIFFPAYLTKITDTITPSFNPNTVFGRSDPIPTYKNTTRKITCEFNLPAFSEYDANEILKKINILVKNLYPGYIENEGQYILNSPPLVRLKYANIISNPFNDNQGLLGFPDAFAISHLFGTEAGTFVVPSPERQTGYVFSKAYTLSFGYTVLHEDVVGWNDSAGQFKNNAEYPYSTISSVEIPETAKIGSIPSNLRGSTTQTPAVITGLTRVLTTL